MKLHANAPLGPKGRRRDGPAACTEQGLALTEAAEAAGVSVRTAGKWARRYRAEGEAGLLDRSSAPRRVANVTPPERVEAIAALRRLRMTGPEIAEVLGMATSTVSAVLLRIGLGRLSRLEPAGAGPPLRALPPGRADPRRRQEARPDRRRRRPSGRSGAKAGVATRPAATARACGAREVGWECVHVCVDDATRLAYVEVLPDEKATTAIGFLRRALAFYRSHGIEVERLMTDNGPAYVSAAHAMACRALGIRHIRTRPLPAPDQRQGRAVHPHDAARVGLRGRLRIITGEGRGPLRLARALQLQPKTWRPRSPTADRAVTGAGPGTTWPASTPRGVLGVSSAVLAGCDPR